jgi:hypothetical protein
MLPAIRDAHTRRRLGLLAVVSALAAAATYLSVGIGRSETPPRQAVQNVAAPRRQRIDAPTPRPAAPAPAPPVPAPAPPVPRLLVSAPARATPSWTAVARVRGRPAAWLAQRSGVTLMRFDQGLAHLTLHAGSSDGGVGGWRYGDRISPREIHLLLAAFNGGFKLTYRDVGFASGGHVAAALKAGLASVVTYTDGTTDVGAWRAGVPSARKAVFSVLQNQRLLVDRGVAAASASSCVLACWGETLGSHTSVARSGLGVTASGQLVWAAGEQLLPAELASALIGAGAVRAIELDINPYWVAGYLYAHHPSGPVPVPVVPGQHGIAGELLEPNSRDFMAIVAN